MNLPLIWSQTLAADAEKAKPFGYVIGYTFAVWAIVLLFVFLARRGYSSRGPTTFLAVLAEHVFHFLDKMVLTVIGSHGRQYLPFIATIWMFVFTANIVGLFAAFTPTANITINLGLSIVTVAYVQYAGIRQNGVGGHIGHFFGPKMTGALVAVSGLVFVVEIISESAKVVSLALRLFGNIEGGKLVAGNLNSLLDTMGVAEGMYVPIGGWLIIIKLLTAIIQAYVWAMLTSVYLGMVTHEPHDHHEEEHGDAPAPAAAAHA